LNKKSLGRHVQAVFGRSAVRRTSLTNAIRTMTAPQSKVLSRDRAPPSTDIATDMFSFSGEKQKLRHFKI
jgi:hypothetical protein